MICLKLKPYFIFILFLLSHVSNAEINQSLTIPDEYCEPKDGAFYENYLYMEKVGTTNEAILRTELLPIVLDDPEGDAEKRIKHRDFRFIVFITGENKIKYIIPNLDKLKEKKILCFFGGRRIHGTSFTYESESHRALTNKFYEYASRHNMYLIKYSEDKIYDFSTIK